MYYYLKKVCLITAAQFINEYIAGEVKLCDLVIGGTLGDATRLESVARAPYWTAPEGLNLFYDSERINNVVFSDERQLES